MLYFHKGRYTYEVAKSQLQYYIHAHHAFSGYFPYKIFDHFNDIRLNS